MASTTDKRIIAINRAINNTTYDQDIDERTYEPFDGGYNRQRGRIIFGIILVILLYIIYRRY